MYGSYSMAVSEKWDGNKAYSYQSQILTHWNSEYFSEGEEYTLIIKVYCQSHGADILSGRDSVDFNSNGDGGNGLRFNFLQLTNFG